MLLVELVVPRHNHNCPVFIVKTHYTINENADKHSANRQNQNKGCKKNCKYITLNQFVAFLSNPIKIEYRGLVFPVSHLFFNGFKASFNYAQSYAFGSLIPSNAYPPTIIKSSYSHFLNTISGLRAPPGV